MRNVPEINRLINDSQYCTKARLYFSSISYADGYDPDEGEVSATTNLLNPITIKGYLIDISNKVTYRNVGKDIVGAVDFFCKKKYKNYFKKCSLVKINGDSYEVWKDGTGSQVLIVDKPFNLVRVTMGLKI